MVRTVVVVVLWLVRTLLWWAWRSIAWIVVVMVVIVATIAWITIVPVVVPRVIAYIPIPVVPSVARIAPP